MLQPKIVGVEPLDDYILKLQYETGEVRLFDVRPYISGDWFGLLRDKKYFGSVHIIAEGNGIEWREGQDIAPHELYEESVFYSPDDATH